MSVTSTEFSDRLVESTIISAGITNRSDEVGFTLMGAGGSDHLNPIQKNISIKESIIMWLKNPIAHAMIEIFLDFVLGDGITFEAVDPKVQEVLDSFFNDIDNSWDEKALTRLRSLSLTGCLPIKPFVNPMTGLVKISTFYQENINRVEMDSENAERIDRIWINDNEYKVITLNPKTQKYEGEIFYFTINRLLHSVNGLSDLFFTHDWLRLYDKSMFASMERIGFMLSHIWDVTIQNADEGTLRKRVAQLKANPPRPGDFRIHNEKESWESKTPNLGGRDQKESFDLYKGQLIGGSRIPEHYFGVGGAINRSTASEMNRPFFRKIRTRQRMVINMFRMMFDFQIFWSKEKGQLNGVEDFSYKI
ncbi:hypothetical protein LCGC14_2522480, partial [marine sediment metagenome]